MKVLLLFNKVSFVVLDKGSGVEVYGFSRIILYDAMGECMYWYLGVRNWKYFSLCWW
jgi:hypothetical protein